jgi:hypothetical protein
MVAGLVGGTALTTLAAIVIAGVSGCGTLHADCTKVSVTASAVQAQGPYAELALSATVSSGGRPLAVVPVKFWVLETGAGLPTGYGEYLGTQKADVDGVARLDRAQGFYGAVLPGKTVTGYYAYIVDTTRVNGALYCGARSAVEPVRCGTSDTCGPMPSSGSVTG